MFENILTIGSNKNHPRCRKLFTQSSIINVLHYNLHRTTHAFQVTNRKWPPLMYYTSFIALFQNVNLRTRNRVHPRERCQAKTKNFTFCLIFAAVPRLRRSYFLIPHPHLAPSSLHLAF